VREWSRGRGHRPEESQWFAVSVRVEHDTARGHGSETLRVTGRKDKQETERDREERQRQRERQRGKTETEREGDRRQRRWVLKEESIKEMKHRTYLLLVVVIVFDEIIFQLRNREWVHFQSKERRPKGKWLLTFDNPIAVCWVSLLWCSVRSERRERGWQVEGRRSVSQSASKAIPGASYASLLIVSNYPNNNLREGYRDSSSTSRGEGRRDEAREGKGGSPLFFSISLIFLINTLFFSSLSFLSAVFSLCNFLISDYRERE
jgi:hypothetical protein